MDGPRMVFLTDADSDFAGRVLVAKLGSAGILAEVRGVSNIYPVLGTASVWVEADGIHDARELITTDAEDALPAAPEPARTTPSRHYLRPVLVAVALLLLGSFALGPRCSPAPPAHTR